MVSIVYSISPVVECFYNGKLPIICLKKLSKSELFFRAFVESALLTPLLYVGFNCVYILRKSKVSEIVLVLYIGQNPD